MDTTNALTAPCEKKSSTQNGSTPHHTTSPGRYQCLAQAIHPIRPHHALNMRPPAPETILEKPKIN